MEFRDKPQVNVNSSRTYEFELHLTTDEEEQLVDLAIRGLAHNILSNGANGVGPINSKVILVYIAGRSENKRRLPISFYEVGRFADLLRLSSETVLGQVQGRHAVTMAEEIDQEITARRFLRELDTMTADDLSS